MDNQHKLVKGYRDFNQQELDTINKVKSAEVEMAELWKQVKAIPDIDHRALAIAKTHLQDAFSWMVRSVAKPVDPFEDKE